MFLFRYQAATDEFMVAVSVARVAAWFLELFKL